MRLVAFFAIFIVGFMLPGCYNLRSSSGGGQTQFSGSRPLNRADVALPSGYTIEVAASGLTFPTGVALDDQGVPHVVEAGYSYGEVFTIPRLLCVNADRTVTEIARGHNNGPWTGVAYTKGAFYVAEGGQLEGGRSLKITPDVKMTTLVEHLPGMGDHHTNGPAIGPDGQVYFGQGTATNSGVVGEDNLKFGWLKRFPKFHDVPCQDVMLTGLNFKTPDRIGGSGRVRTGAYVPFGTQLPQGK